MIPELWIDADSVPKCLRPIILKAAVRLNTAAYFVADRELKDVRSFIAEDTHRIRIESNNTYLKSQLKMIVVNTGDNSADDYIVNNSKSGSLCITHDIPLADRLLNKGCFVIDDRGGEYNKETIKVRLSDRDVNSQLREAGLFINKQKIFSESVKKEFADNLDRIITRLSK